VKMSNPFDDLVAIGCDHGLLFVLVIFVNACRCSADRREAGRMSDCRYIFRCRVSALELGVLPRALGNGWFDAAAAV